MLNKNHIVKTISENLPLIAILIGVVLVSLPLGPYQTPDTLVEFSTAQGVLRWGYPYLEVKGNFIDVPPLGFYVEALFFLVFGLSMENGVALVLMFGLACTLLVFKLGKEVYGKSSGLFAAAFFALTPWQLVLSRAFLIDVQCLFLSLVCLYFGMLAIRRDSVKLAAVSGVFFAAAFLTKQYAVFMLIPLFLLFLYQRPKNPRQILLQIVVFVLPAVFSTLFWYQLIMGKELLYLVQHNDFTRVNFPGVVPSYSFMPTFLIDHSLGFFFLVAVVFSLIVGFLFWRRFSRQWAFFDLVSLVTILLVLGVNMYLGVNLNLKAPYTSAIKYSYQSLPFFSLVAASLAGKSASLLRSSKRFTGESRVLAVSLGLTGLFFLVTPLIANMVTAQWLTMVPHVIFRVEPDLDVGYSFIVFNQVDNNVLLLNLQFLGFMTLILGLLLSSRPFLFDLFNQSSFGSSEVQLESTSKKELLSVEKKDTSSEKGSDM